MEMESVSRHHEVPKQDKKINNFLNLSLLFLNILVLGIGNTGGPLLLRLYFIRGGKRIWFSSWLETAGWPVMLLPLSVSYLYRSGTNSNQVTKIIYMTPSLFMASAALGVLIGLDDYFYAYGLSSLPVSTSALITSTQLSFTAEFAFLTVKQKFTSYSINSIVILTVGAVVLGVHANSDRPDNESDKQYCIGFFMTLAASGLYGFILPMTEFTLRKARQIVTYSLVMEMQMVMGFFATAFCTVGMLINKDFQVLNLLSHCIYYLN